jgi:GTP-binding protein HflX
VRSWTHLERQRGGFGFLGGPGETQIETDRRIIGERIDVIGKELEQVKRTRAMHRESRRARALSSGRAGWLHQCRQIDPVQRADRRAVLAEDTLFATLDPTIALIALAGGSKAVLSDTWASSRICRRSLFAAFRATLEEVLEADLILHVRDMADHASASQRADVIAVLGGLGIEAEAEPDRIIEVWNKADLLDDAALKRIAGEAKRVSAVLVSAVTGFGLDALRAAIERKLNRARQTIEIMLSPTKALCRTGSTRIAKWCSFGSRRGNHCASHSRAPEKRDRLARLAGPARLRLAAE